MIGPFLWDVKTRVSESSNKESSVDLGNEERERK